MNTTTPRTDAVAKEIGKLAAAWNFGDIRAHDFAASTQSELSKLGQIEIELADRDAQIVALRKTLAECDEYLMRYDSNAGSMRRTIANALSTPPPPCVPLAEHQKYKDAFESARAFIDSHAADPDLTPKMCEAYAAYQEKLKTLP